ncbi:MAG: hypothetical protein ABIN79_03220 [Marmoricola sp.]
MDPAPAADALVGTVVVAGGVLAATAIVAVAVSGTIAAHSSVDNNFIRVSHPS